MPSPLSAQDVEALAARTDFLWHQRFELAPGIFSPGANDVGWLLHTAGVPADLTGARVLDIGTTNGGAAFMLERRGAAKVVATDIVDPMHFGFEAIRSALGSNVEFRQLSVYELSRTLQEQFDYVVFWGVLYHLRHPLLALDNVRAVTAHTAYVETAVCDFEAPEHTETAMARSIAATSWAPMAVTGSLPMCAHWSTGAGHAGWSPRLSAPGPRRDQLVRW